jgi:very-short-patch-repair endonuclease
MKGQSNRSILASKVQRLLRKNMTDAKIALWRRLRLQQIAGYKFRRQHPFLDYVLDFVCLEKMLVVEVDGGQHAECAHDEVRDRRLQEAGFRVLRFWNNQVLHEIDGVVEVIWQALCGETSTPPHPLPVVSPLLRRSTGGEQCSPKPLSCPLEGEGKAASEGGPSC